MGGLQQSLVWAGTRGKSGASGVNGQAGVAEARDGRDPNKENQCVVHSWQWGHRAHWLHRRVHI